MFSRNFSNLSALSVHIKKMSSINLFQNQGLISWVFRNSVLMWSKKYKHTVGQTSFQLSFLIFVIKLIIEPKQIVFKNEVNHITYIFCRYSFIRDTFHTVI